MAPVLVALFMVKLNKYIDPNHRQLKFLKVFLVIEPTNKCHIFIKSSLSFYDTQCTRVADVYLYCSEWIAAGEDEKLVGGKCVSYKDKNMFEGGLAV